MLKGRLCALLGISAFAFLPVGCADREQDSAALQSVVIVPGELLERHDFSLADTPNKRTALAYLYSAWNDGEISEARATYWEAGSFLENATAGPPADLPDNIGSPQYTVHKVIEEGNRVVVLSLVEGVGMALSAGTRCIIRSQ